VTAAIGAHVIIVVSQSHRSITKLTIVYKICPAALWREAERSGVFRGSPVDAQDGFIHFSSAEQASETAAKHFAGERDLVLLRVDAARLGARLKWEPSRGGALFPHLYGELELAAVIRVDPLPLAANGRHRFPSLDP
jgi:uncharacterized protein (DUF952 family)